MNPTAKINYLNMGLMLVSALAAFIMPFEVFLFAYAILGPLHYLTEISWLHDRNYFTKGKFDVLVLMLVGIIMLLSLLDNKLELSLGVNDMFTYRAMFTAFFGALVFVTVKNEGLKWLGIVMVLFLSFATDKLYLFLLVFLPTLIHVFIFTAIFVLYGALKSRSISGLISFVMMILIPLALIKVAPGKIGIPITDYGMNAYNEFKGLNAYTLKTFFGAVFTSEKDFVGKLFHSDTGIAIQRFIAYAYTYHYLNWFSKTNIIRWHEVPKSRFAVVIAAWVAAVAIYLYNYKLGFEVLFFLSFLHVLLEFPLNFVSMIGIGKEVKTIFEKGKFANA